MLTETSRTWWTAADAKGFEKRAKQYAQFFDSIQVLPGLHANGEFTLGENLADHGGLQVAFNAYKNATKDKQLKNWDGFTPDQRFFLAYAGVWASNITEQRSAAASRATLTHWASGVLTELFHTSEHGTKHSTSLLRTRCTSLRVSVCSSGKHNFS